MRVKKANREVFGYAFSPAKNVCFFGRKQELIILENLLWSLFFNPLYTNE